MDSDWETPTDVEIAWLAGLLEGEGSFMAHWATTHKNNGSDQRYFRIDLSMTDEDVVRKAARLMGATSLFVQNRKETGRKPMWRTRLMGKHAREVAKLIRPHM